MKQRKLFIRIVCVFLAILMLGGVLVAALQAFALEPQTMSIAATGETSTGHILLIVGIVAVVLLLGATFAPKIVDKVKK